MFYDNWVARDINGTALENAPFEQIFHHTESNHRFQRHLPIQGILLLLQCKQRTLTMVKSNHAGTVLPCWIPLRSTNLLTSGSEWPTWLKANALPVNVLLSAVSLFFFSFSFRWVYLISSSDDYFNAGYGRIIMVPRVKLAYDRKVWDIIHPERRNLTAIRGYKRIGGLPDDPHSDPQDRSWYGPHDRLFTPEETEELEFVPGPEYGKSTSQTSNKKGESL